MSWAIVRSNKFKRQYKQKTPELRSKVDDAILAICESNNPRTLGKRKHGSLRACYGHDIDFRNRILFFPDLTKREILFLRVCSHKEVYTP